MMTAATTAVATSITPAMTMAAVSTASDDDEQQ